VAGGGESPAPVMGGSREADSAVVGRVHERGRIAEWLGAARSGHRQVAFITGEAGIGKTTLVDAALRELRRASEDECSVARGQCVEHFGGGEPYLPVLDALAGLCRGSNGPLVPAALPELPPHWLPNPLGPALSPPRPAP